jgi:hypothetical protein
MLTPQEIRQIGQTVIKNIQPPDELLSTKKCAELLGITTEALGKRCSRGTIPYHKKHGTVYFSKNEVTKYYTTD